MELAVVVHEAEILESPPVGLDPVVDKVPETLGDEKVVTVPTTAELGVAVATTGKGLIVTEPVFAVILKSLEVAPLIAVAEGVTLL